MAETGELENVSEASFATATSQGYRTEEDEGISAFEVSVVQLGWQNDELISDRWVKIEDQPAVRVMNLVKQEDDSYDRASDQQTAGVGGGIVPIESKTSGDECLHFLSDRSGGYSG